MTGIALALPILLAVAVLSAWLRLALWYRRAPVRVQWWRLTTLIVAQPIVAALLYLTLMPPARDTATGTLVVATAGASRIVPIAGGERLVALPEAGAVAGAARAPDLATALRTDPGIARLRIVGEGLGLRDRPAAATRSLAFDPPALPHGLVALDPPPPTAPGDAFTVGARIANVEGGRVDLLDPAGRMVDSAPIPAGGTLVLTGTARTPGVALFVLRVHDARGAILEEPAVPVRTDASPATRVLILAGAPGPEVKALRRWASDAGLTPGVRVDVGGGAALSDAAIAVTPAALARIDVAVLDDRAWNGLSGGARQAVAAAVRGGMGLVVRITGPVPRGWQVLGLGALGATQTVPVNLPPSGPSDAMLAARRGPGTRDVPAAMAGERDSVPVLTRQAATIGGAGAIPLLRDARGAAFAAWRATGRGRVALVTLQDSFALVTSGHGDRHGEIWSKVVAAVARPLTTPVATIDALPRVGERVAICGAGDAAIVAPDGRMTRLLVDPATGAQRCAGYWPAEPGWHRLTGPAARDVYVYPAAALTRVRQTERREATLRLVGDRTSPQADGATTARGASWPWALAWLIAASALWWFERSRLGRQGTAIAR